MKTIFITSLGAALMLVGCGAKNEAPVVQQEEKPVVVASVTPGQETTLLPLAKGNEWVYDDEIVITDHQGKSTRREARVTQRVVSISDIPGGKRAIINVFSKDVVVDRQTIDVTAKGMFQIDGGARAKIPYSPLQPMLLFPLKGNEKFTWKGTGPMGHATVENVVQGPQEVDTAQGRMSGIAVESKIKFQTDGTQGEALNRAWFAPKVGMIRVVTDVKVNGTLTQETLQLKSYKVN